MADEEQSPDRLWVRVEGDAACVRVEGRGSFRVSGALKEFALASLESGARRLALDFRACVGMDSTFMGVLAGLAFRFRKLPGGRVLAFNLSARTRQLLATLGLDRIVETRMAADDAPAPAPAAGSETVIEAPAPRELDRERLGRDMIEAHEDLLRVSADNRARFKDVIEYLREDLRKPSGRPAP